MARLSRKAEETILSRVRACVGKGISHCEAKHSRMEENQSYTRGMQWSAADIQRQERRERPAVPWNDTFKVVHAISNREMVSRLVPKVFGRNLQQEGVANVLDEACRWQRQVSGSEHYGARMAFRAAAMGGYGCAHDTAGKMAIALLHAVDLFLVAIVFFVLSIGMLILFADPSLIYR